MADEYSIMAAGMCNECHRLKREGESVTGLENGCIGSAILLAASARARESALNSLRESQSQRSYQLMEACVKCDKSNPLIAKGYDPNLNL